MFGYVLPYKPELKMRHWQEYRSVYCGLCKELKREYGMFSRLFLNYDLVLLALLCDSIAGQQGECSPQRCITNPVQQRPMCGHTKGLALAADALVLTVYYKLLDDVADEGLWKKISAMMLRGLLKGSQKKAAIRQPQLDFIFAKESQAQTALEAQKTQSVDAAAEPTAQMTAALFAATATEPAQQKALFRMGLFVGKILYYLDAAEDYEADAKQGSYNVFLLQGDTKAQAVEETRRLCNMCAGEASLCYNLLPLKAYKPLLDNILFLGIPQSIEAAGIPRKKQNFAKT